MKRLVLAVALLSLAGCKGSSGANPGPDTTAPEIQLLQVSPKRAAAGTLVKIDFEVSEPVAKVAVFVASGSASCGALTDTSYECSYKVVGNEGEGDQPVDVTATDKAGNVGKASTTLTIDTTAPTVTFTHSPAPATKEQAGTIEFVADEEASFTCSLDDAPAAACSSPYPYSALNEGAHSFAVQATDDVGNQGSARIAFTVDLTAPHTRIDQAPPAATNLAQVEVDFSSDEASATFQCQLDGAGFATCQSPLELTGYAEGSHHFEVRAVDTVGNADPNPAAADFVYDITPPKTTLAPIPDTGLATRAITFTASEAGCTFACALDAAAPVACTSPWALGGLSDGTHALAIQATDAAGNVEASPAQASFVVDTVGPVASFTKTPPDPSLTPNASFEFTATDANGAPATFACHLDAAAYAPCTSPDAVIASTAGKHTFYLRPSDRYGNAGAEISFAWTVDLSAPYVTITAQPPAYTRQRDASLSFTGSRANMTFACALDGAAASACTSPQAYPGLADGAHSVQIVGTDTGGHASAPAIAGWTVDNVAPTTTIAAIADTGQPTRTVTFTASEINSTFQCSLDAAAFAACTSPLALTGLAEGTRNLTVRATDLAGNQETPGASASFVVDVTGPVSQILTGPTDPSSSADATFTFTATDASSFTFECALDAASFASCTSPAQVTVTADGKHAFHLRATDKYGNVGAAVEQDWSVDAFPPIATLTGKPSDPTNQTTATFTFSANKTTVTWTCALDGAAASACTSPQGYPGLADGTHTFAAIATDSASRASQPAQAGWTVDTVAPSVSFQKSPPALSNKTAAHFEFSASEPGCTFACSLDGATFAACASPWDITVGDGAHTLNVRATDPAGNVGDPAPATFTVDLVPPGVPAIHQADPSLTTDITPTFSWDAATDAASYSIDVATTSDFGQIAQTAAGLTTLSYVATPLPSSRYYYRVKATDAAGNDSAYSLTGILEVRTWGFLNPLPQGATIAAAACLDASNCWFVGEAGLATRTNDGGASFKQASTGVAGNLTAVHLFDASNLMAVGAGGAILRTGDGGVTWSSVPSGVTADLYGLRFLAQTGYAVGDGGLILKSSDGGQTWSKLTSGTVASLRDAAFLDTTGASVVVAGGTGAVLRSDDYGQSWAPQASCTTGLLRALSFVDASHGWAVGPYTAAGTCPAACNNSCGGNMRQTQDGGKSWTLVATGMGKDLWGATRLDVNNGYTLGDSDTTTTASLRRTGNAGSTWTEATAPRPSLRALVSLGSTLYAVGDGGNVLKSVDSGATFLPVAGVTGTLSNQTSDQEIRSVSFASATTGWIFGGSGLAMKTSDGGATLSAVDPAGAVITSAKSLYASSFSDAITGWTGGDSSFVAYTADGSTWSKAGLPAGVTIFVRGMHFFPTWGVMVGTSGKIVRWTASATPALPPSSSDFTLDTNVTTSLRAVRMVDPTHGFAVGDGGKIYADSASGWAAETSGTSKDLFGVWAFDASNALAVGDQGTLLRRTASGWLPASSGTAAVLRGIGFLDANHGWIVGDGTLLVTTDGGNSWTRQLSPTGSTLWSIAPVTPDLAYASGSSRNFVKTTLGGR